jgi:uncharacterized membrane protein YecN with MAPEG domain
MEEKSLWEEFNLAQANPDRGGGILYCLRYPEDRLRAHQKQVISAINDLGAVPKDLGEFITVVPGREWDLHERRRVAYLLEELSVLNEALEYVDVGFGVFNNVSELKDGLIMHYLDALLKRGDVLHAYGLVTSTIPGIAKDLRTAHEQNRVLSPQDEVALRDMEFFSLMHTNMMDSYLKFDETY